MSKTQPPTVEGARRRDLSLETLRGIAVLLMVFGHVVGDQATNGLEVPDDSWLRYLYYSVEFIRMPLFTVISGYVYAIRPLRQGSIGRFIQGKARRLLVPFLAVGLLQLCARSLAPSHRPTEWSHVWDYFVYGFDQFWFVQALFVIFGFVAVAENFGWLSHRRGWVMASAFALLATTALPRYEFLSLWGAEYLAPYFLLGLAVRRYEERIPRAWATGIALAVCSVGTVMHQCVWFHQLDVPVDQMSWLALTVGLSGTGLLLLHRPSFSGLAVIGSSSFAIYLFHVFGTAGTRIGCNKLGIDSTEFSSTRFSAPSIPTSGRIMPTWPPAY